MLTDLRTYYDKKAIGALSFDCTHVQQCAADSPRFTTAKEAYVGPQYETGTLPRVLFLSLDSGSAELEASARTLEANRMWMRAAAFASFPKGRHWYETHELAWAILRPFKPGLTIEEIGPYFAHTSSAKCCQNNPGSALASETLFRNCRAFIPDEIRILRPDILVTQGDYARDAVSGAFEVESQQVGAGDAGACRATILRLTPTQRTIWFHTYHPSAYGLYWREKNSCWPFFTDAAVEFLRDRWPAASPRLTRVVSTSAAPNVRTPPAAPTSRKGLPPLPSQPARSAVSPNGNLHTLIAAFNRVFGVNGRPFGSPHSRHEGVSDDAAGVQWNAGIERDEHYAWLGVNLEGMAYDGWPIARFIERELDRPTLPDLCRTLPQAESIVMSWTRDAWQAAARLPIAKIQIGPTPRRLDNLTPEVWRTILLEAYRCLDPDRGHRGRATQTVTLNRGPAEKAVSPHLHIERVLWRGVSKSQDEAEAKLVLARDVLMALHQFVADRCQ